MTTSIQFSGEGLVVDAKINAAGMFAFGSKAPRLILPIELRQAVPAPEGVVFELSALYGTLQTGHGHDRQVVSEALPEPIEELARDGGRSLQLSFPIDHARLHWLEELRDGTREMSFTLFLRLTARKLARLQPLPNPSYAYIKGVDCKAYDAFLSVPRDRWLSVLEATKYGLINVFEFPAVPVEHRDTLQNAFTALREAKTLHLAGFYDKAVGECRIALDKFWDERPKRLRDEWKAYLDEEEHKWLGEAFTAIRRGANGTHHNARIGYDHFESLMFINLTSSLVAYVARAGVSESSDTESP